MPNATTSSIRTTRRNHAASWTSARLAESEPEHAGVHPPLRIEQRLDARQYIAAGRHIEPADLVMRSTMPVHHVTHGNPQLLHERAGLGVRRSVAETGAIALGQIFHVQRIELVTPIEHRLHGDGAA